MLITSKKSWMCAGLSLRLIRPESVKLESQENKQTFSLVTFLAGPSQSVLKVLFEVPHHQTHNQRVFNLSISLLGIQECAQVQDLLEETLNGQKTEKIL